VALYRVASNLWVKGEILRPGAISRLEAVSQKALEVLASRGIVRPFQGPPLSELPGWQARSRRLSAIGITGSVEFLEVDPHAVARHMRVAASLVERWQREVEEAITVAPKRAKG
jgi:hypothetical protein